MKFAHIAAKMYQLVSVSQIALHMAISVDTVP
jgi:hypothetical protein